MNYSYEFNQLLDTIKKYPISSSQYPSYLEGLFQEAIQLKRQGYYNDSFRVFIDLIENESCVYTGILNGIFKVAACAGYLNATKSLLMIGNDAMKNEYNPFGLTNNFQDHLERLNYAVEDESSLLVYLKSISGNPYYTFPYDYSELKRDYYK